MHSSISRSNDDVNQSSGFIPVPVDDHDVGLGQDDPEDDADD